MNVAVERLRYFGIDLRAEPGQAPESRLDVTAGTAKTVIKIEMPKRGVEIVLPHQAHHATAEPDAFRVSGRSVDDLRRLHELIGLALVGYGVLAIGAMITDFESTVRN